MAWIWGLISIMLQIIHQGSRRRVTLLNRAENESSMNVQIWSSGTLTVALSYQTLQYSCDIPMVACTRTVSVCDHHDIWILSSIFFYCVIQTPDISVMVHFTIVHDPKVSFKNVFKKLINKNVKNIDHLLLITTPTQCGTKYLWLLMKYPLV